MASERAIERLSQPAPRHWISGRVVVTLSHYFVAQQEAAVVKAIADDWADLLSEYPAWAIAKACKWWISRENEHHHRKPLPGDIQDRAHREMGAVRAARMVLERGIAAPEPEREPVAVEITDEERARRAALVAELWSGPKEMKKGDA